MTDSSQTAYQTTPVDYLTEITRLFGDYKKRAFSFMNLQPGEKLLDTGCGTGDDLLALANLMQGALKLHGVDLEQNSIITAKSRAEAAGVEIDYQQGNLSSLPFENDTMDVVRSDRVFQHLRNPEDALQEMIRVTRPGGRIIAIDVDWGTLVMDHPMSDFSDRLCGFFRDHHTNGRSGRQLRQWFVKAGLKEVDGYADAVCVSNWEIGSYIWGLRAALDQFVGVGGADAEEAKTWWDLAVKQGEKNLFCGSMTGFVMRGLVS